MPRVSVRNWLRKPSRPRVGTLKRMWTWPSPGEFMSSISPLPPAKLLDHDAAVFFGDINLHFFQRLHADAVFFMEDDFRLRDLQFVAFAPHGFDQDGQMQLAPARNAELVGGVGVFDAQGDIGLKFFHQPLAQLAGRGPLAFAARSAATC